MVYLNTAGVDFEGGSTTFLDDAESLAREENTHPSQETASASTRRTMAADGPCCFTKAAT
jgi:hypothetical protein